MDIENSIIEGLFKCGKIREKDISITEVTYIGQSYIDNIHLYEVNTNNLYRTVAVSSWFNVRYLLWNAFADEKDPIWYTVPADALADLLDIPLDWFAAIEDSLKGKLTEVYAHIIKNQGIKKKTFAEIEKNQGYHDFICITSPRDYDNPIEDVTHYITRFLDIRGSQMSFTLEGEIYVAYEIESI